MKFNLPLGKWFGIPVILHWSWVLLFLLVLIIDPHFAFAYAGLFVLVLMHEFGHALMGRRLNYVVHSITLYPMGGLARMDIPVDPRQELLVAIAGPAVNAMLIPVFLMLPNYKLFVIWQLCNIMLLVFNLLPALPMDGGRVLRAVLAMTLNNHYKATLIAARVSQVICVIMGVFAIMYGFYMMAAIAFLIFFAALGEIEVSKNRWTNGRIEARSAILESANALSSIQKRIAQLDK